MSALRRVFPLILVCMTMLSAPALAQETSPDPASLWADFNHYILIARPDLAQAAGEKLLQEVEADELLAIVEASDYENYEQTLARAVENEDLREIARQVSQRIEEGRLNLSRDEERIAENIELLSEGQRPYRNAVRRLSAAGQYAVPQMLETLQDDEQRQLHPYIVSALVEMGRPVVYPLSVTLGQLEPQTQSAVARVLARISYPEALPYLQQAIQDPDADPSAKEVMQTAYQRLAEEAGVNTDYAAAQLFEALGRSQYQAATAGTRLPGYDEANEQGIVWRYSETAGLVPVPVPGVIYGDVRAMDSAVNALELNEDLAPALSLYLMANLRRENRLPEGEVDPSYPAEARPAEFYAMIAGPLRLHDVLARALADRDPTLALDAIEALARTAGTQALVNVGAGTQPLLDALSYPSRRVRFRAAEALANARPQQAFPEAYRVVPALAEGIRADGRRFALAIADEQSELNRLRAEAEEAGYVAIGGESLEDVQEQIEARPSIDLVLLNQEPEQLVDTIEAFDETYELATAPVVAVVEPAAQYTIGQQLQGLAQQVDVVAADNEQLLQEAVSAVANEVGAEPLSDQEADEMALTALQVLRELALGNPVYQVEEALPALTLALRDERSAVVTGAGRVLALIDDSQAQRALAEAALAQSSDLQIQLLESLAESATYFGNLLPESRTQELLDLVQNAEGETAIAAAEAHGALTLPTANAVQMILEP
ncbi:MAG: HEAT repeat domain-containing protein [Phycisphaeraceae bacterium]